MELATLEQVAEWLGMPSDGGAQGPALTRAMNVAEKSIFRICGRNVGALAQHGFVTGSKVEYLNGWLGDTLILAYTPVTAVASVVVVYSADSSGTESTTTIALSRLQCDGYPLGGSAFNAEAGVLGYRSTGQEQRAAFEYGEPLSNFLAWAEPAFPDGHKKVKVTYTGGYATTAIPADLQQAAIEYAASIFKRSGAWKGGGGTSEAFTKQVMDTENERLMSLLSPYIRPGV